MAVGLCWVPCLFLCDRFTFSPTKRKACLRQLPSFMFYPFTERFKSLPVSPTGRIHWINKRPKITTWQHKVAIGIRAFLRERRCQGRWHPSIYDTLVSMTLIFSLFINSSKQSLRQARYWLLGIKYFWAFKQSPIAFCFNVNLFGQEDPKPSCFHLTDLPNFLCLFFSPVSLHTCLDYTNSSGPGPTFPSLMIYYYLTPFISFSLPAYTPNYCLFYNLFSQNKMLTWGMLPH